MGWDGIMYGDWEKGRKIKVRGAMKERIDVWGLRWMLGRGGHKGCCSCCLKTPCAVGRKKMVLDKPVFPILNKQD